MFSSHDGPTRNDIDAGPKGTSLRIVAHITKTDIRHLFFLSGVFLRQPARGDKRDGEAAGSRVLRVDSVRHAQRVGGKPSCDGGRVHRLGRL